MLLIRWLWLICLILLIALTYNHSFTILKQWRSVEKWGSGTIVEALRSGKPGCSNECYRHGMIRGGAQACHWRPHNYNQLTNCQLKKCRHGSREYWFLAVTKRTQKQNLTHIKGTIYCIFGLNMDLHTSEYTG